MRTAIIIGAGPAGLTAAYELLTQTDIKPIVLESDSQVGGISKTINYKDNRIDLGGHRFFSKSDKVIQWWLQFLSLDTEQKDASIQIQYQNKTKVFNAPQAGNITVAKPSMLIRKRKSRIYYQKKFFDYPLQLNITTLRKLGVVKVVRIGLSYLHAKIVPHKQEDTLAQFFRNRFGRELYETFFKDYTEKVWGVKCEELPASWGYQRIKDLNIGKAIAQALKSVFVSNKSIDQKGTSTSLIEQFLYPKYGPGEMWDTVADEITRLGGQIHLSQEVIRINAGENNVVESIVTKNKNTGLESVYTGDLFISSMPVKHLLTRLVMPGIKDDILKLANGLEYREFIIVGILTKKAVVAISKKNEALTDNWIYLQDNNIKAGRLQIFNNWSPFMVNDPDTMWIGVEYFCNEGDAFWNKSDTDIAQTAITEIENIGFINAEDVIDKVVIRVEKAYPSYTGTYERFGEIIGYLDKFPNLYAVGRNGMHRYNNSDHSMLTAMQAVENIKNNVRDKGNIWSINVEDDYHEEK